MLHSRSHIDELQMWQKVKELASSFILTAVQFEVCAYVVIDVQYLMHDTGKGDFGGQLYH